MEVSSAFLKRAAQTAAGLHRCSFQWRMTLWPEPPACRSAAMTSSVPTPVALLLAHCHRTWGWWVNHWWHARRLYLKWGRVAHRQPHSLVWDHLYPVAGLGRDDWRWRRMQWMTKMSFRASSCSVHSTVCCCSCLPLRWTIKVSSAESAGVQSSHA